MKLPGAGGRRRVPVALPALLLAPWTAAAARTGRAAGRGGGLREPLGLLSAAVDELATAAADAEVASDLAALAESGGSLARGEPGTLEAYCSGKGGGNNMDEGVQVEADWMGYGMRYPGEISDMNKDGTVDIHYDDGFDEKRVSTKRVKIVEEEAKPQGDPANDPACQLQDFTKKLKKKVKEVQKDMGEFIRAKTAIGVQDAGFGAHGDEASMGTGGSKGGDGGAGAEGAAGGDAASGAGAGGERGWSSDGAGDGTSGAAKGSGAGAGTASGAGKGDSAGASTAGAAGAGEDAGAGAGDEGEEEDLDKAEKEINATKDQSEELERLKEQLSAKDNEIQGLERELKRMDDLMRGKDPSGRHGEDKEKTRGPKTIDDLIAEYRARIARRDRRIAALKAKLARKKEKLAEDPKKQEAKQGMLPFEPPSLAEIGAKVKELSEDVDEARKKRDRIEADGDLDPELAHTLDGIFSVEEQLSTEFEALETAEEEMRKSREAAEKAAKEAEAVARKAAEAASEAAAAIGGGSEKAAEEAKKATEAAAKEAQKVTEELAEKVKVMDSEVLKKAISVGKDLESVKDQVNELDTGIHPHGHKWWRYRYEHAYVEALLMVFVCFLMLIWERVYQFMRWKVYQSSNACEYDRITHGTMYISWLEFCAGELMACLLVFLTCWVLAECNAFEVFPIILQESSALHLPHDGLEYRRLALDVCVVFFFAIVFYYALTLSVVHATTHKLDLWTALEQMQDDQAAASMASTPLDAGEPASARSRTLRHHAQQAYMPTLPTASLGLTALSSTEALRSYKHLKEYFFTKVANDPVVAASTLPRQLDDDNFPFWVYIRLAVRKTMDRLFQFGVPVWVCLIVTFIALLFLHRFAHIGCVRLMVVTALFLAGLLALMFWWISRLSYAVEAWSRSPDGAESQPSAPDDRSIHQQVSTEAAVIFCMHYLLFMMCYFAARMICQPWMWRLHFWMVLSLSAMLAVLGALFMVKIAPMIPDFCVALAVPPYVDPDDVTCMHEAIRAGQDLGGATKTEALEVARRKDQAKDMSPRSAAAS